MHMTGIELNGCYSEMQHSKHIDGRLPMTEIEILYANFELNKRSCQTHLLNINERTNERTEIYSKNNNNKNSKIANECKQAHKQEI